jgi:hypothetical protein
LGIQRRFFSSTASTRHAGSRVEVVFGRGSGLSLPVNQLSRSRRHRGRLGELVIERADRTLRLHHLQLGLMQLLGCDDVGGVGLLGFLHVLVVDAVEISANFDGGGSGGDGGSFGGSFESLFGGLLSLALYCLALKKKKVTINLTCHNLTAFRFDL